jgi:hypothetical protein
VNKRGSGGCSGLQARLDRPTIGCEQAAFDLPDAFATFVAAFDPAPAGVVGLWSSWAELE